MDIVTHCNIRFCKTASSKILDLGAMTVTMERFFLANCELVLIAFVFKDGYSNSPPHKVVQVRINKYP